MVEVKPGTFMLTKVANGINAVEVTEVDAEGRIHYRWRDGAQGSVARDEIGRIGDTEKDYQYVIVEGSNE